MPNVRIAGECLKSRIKIALRLEADYPLLLLYYADAVQHPILLVVYLWIIGK